MVKGDHDFIISEFSKIYGEEAAVPLTEKIDKHSAFAYCKDNDYGCPVYIFIYNHDELDYGLIVHEAYHLLFMMYEAIGYEHQPNDELEAYIFENLFEELVKFVQNESEDTNA